jgi:hypothetical protein
MNDSKYLRLYPERAVRPLLILARRIREEAAKDRNHLASVSEHSLDMALHDLDALGFPPDEPLFLLRGQDVLAPDTIRFYVGIAADRLAPIAKQHDHLYDFALDMERWQPRKLPD